MPLDMLCIEEDIKFLGEMNECPIWILDRTFYVSDHGSL